MAGIKSDAWIKKMAREARMIEPFVDHQVGDGVVSFGLSSYGYDVRVSNNFSVFTNLNSSVVDPQAFDRASSLVEKTGSNILIPPNSFALGHSVEYFRIPRNVLVLCIGKSTYARCGIIVNVTPLEPEWEGHITIEISNTTPLPARIHSGQGITQLLFLESDEVCETSYADRKGKYQKQTGVTTPRI